MPVQLDGTHSVASQQKKVLLLGATGTIGRAVAAALLAAGYSVTCFVRQRSADQLRDDANFDGIDLRIGEVTDPESLTESGFSGDDFDVLISCLASRDGDPKDVWELDDQANRSAFKIAKDCGVRQIILLSAICVQKPRLEFQRAKLSAEAALAATGIDYTIVRPTAFFKSLSGQIDRVRQGKPYLLFGDGKLTACKPISNEDLATFMVSCISEPNARNRVMPIGGPGPAITPLNQGEVLFKLLGKEPKFRYVPLAVIKTIAGALSFVGKVIPRFKKPAEFARIGQYYATESMLVWDEQSACYDADATPSFGNDTLFDYYAAVINGVETVERGEHSVF